MLIDDFKNLYRDVNTTRAMCEQGRLGEIYTEDIVFRDPVHEIRGLSSLSAYFDTMYGNVSSCEFSYLDEWVFEGNACIKWDMCFRHKRLASGRAITVRGVTHIRFSERIDYHEDIYDVGAMIYEHVPVIRHPIRWLKTRLGAA